MKTNNPIFKGCSGRLGDMVFRTVHGQTHICKRPAMRSRTTEKQTAVISKFRQATQYAKQQVGDPALKELYEHGITDRKLSAYQMAVSDYLNAPKVHSIDTQRYQGKIDDKILVAATDDFMVVGVKIIIVGSDGLVIEEGEAGPSLHRADHWSYKATVVNPSLPGTRIRAVAYDRPGNATSLEKVL